MNIKGTLFENKWQLIEKSSIPPVKPSECLYLKGIQDFYPSLEPSRAQTPLHKGIFKDLGRDERHNTSDSL